MVVSLNSKLESNNEEEEGRLTGRCIPNLAGPASLPKIDLRTWYRLWLNQTKFPTPPHQPKIDLRTCRGTVQVTGVPRS